MSSQWRRDVRLSICSISVAQAEDGDLAAVFDDIVRRLGDEV
jgi:hypothetical protein